MTGEKLIFKSPNAKLDFCSSNCLRVKLLNKKKVFEAFKIFGQEIINDVASTVLMNILHPYSKLN